MDNYVSFEENFIVQKDTLDEWNISATLEGNIDSKKLVVMVHGGGYDRDENGLYPIVEDGLPKRIDGKVIFTKKPFGNYQRLSYELSANDIDCAILRIDLRNHGKSLMDEKMDERDTSFIRFSNDLKDVINQVKEKYGYESVHLVGTCAGALTCLYYVTRNNTDIKSMTLVSPLSPYIISTDNPEHGFNYKKVMSIKNGEVKQFTKMKGMFEGIETIKEAESNFDLYDKINDDINIMYIASPSDRLIPWDITQNIIEKLNHKDNFNYKIIEKEKVHGNADHCFYDPQSSDALLTESYTFLNNQIEREKTLHF